MKKSKLHTGLAGKMSQTLAKKLGLSEMTVRPEAIQPSVATTAIRSKEPGRQIGVPRTGIRRLGSLLGGAMFRISNSIRKSAGIRSPTTKLIRGNHDVSTGGSNIFINKGGSREAFRPKFTSNTYVYNAAGKEAHWRHLSLTGTATSTRTARPLGTPCGLMATSLALISLTTTPENEPTKCAKDDKRSDPRLPKKKSSTAKAKPKTQQKTSTAAP